MEKLKLVLIAVLLLCSGRLLSQEAVKGTEQAEHVFSLLLHNNTDTLYSLFSDAVKAQLSPQQLEGGMKQMEQMMGNYQGHATWEYIQQDNNNVYTSVLDFERGQTSFVVVFDENGSIQGLRIMPRSSEPSADDIALPDDAVEIDDTVHTSPDIALPCSIVMSGKSVSPPIVVFVHGSGATDRNEAVLANRPFLDLSRKLAERGISSVRYDKRTFVYPQDVSSMDDETILDALSAIQMAHNYSDRVFLIGHSLGAMLAPIIAKRCQLEGIIMMAAPARDISEVLNEQLEYLSPSGTAEEQKQEAIEQIRNHSPHYLQPQHQLKIAQSLSIPMLIMQGERDYQVSMNDFALWRQALVDKKNVSFISYPKLNHLFLEGEGKSTPQEYSIKGAIPAQVADDIAAFIFHKED